MGQLVWNRLMSLRYGVAALWLCGRKYSERGLWLLPGLCSFIHEDAVPWHSSWCQTLRFLPVYHWCPSSCCPSAGVQWEWVSVISKSAVDPLRGDAWESCSFFCHPNPHWFSQPEVLGTYLPGTGTLSWVVWCGAGIPHFQYIHPDFYPQNTMPVLCLNISAPATCLDECDFCNSLVSDFHTAQLSDDSG